MNLDQFLDDSIAPAHVLSLLSNMGLAEKLTQVMQKHHLRVQHFDRAASLVEQARKNRPYFILFDFDTREAEAFEALKTFRFDADLKGVPVIGYVSQAKRSVQEEARQAGCLKVLLKTEFFKSLDDLIVRFSK